MTQPARTLTDADVEAIAERLAARLADLPEGYAGGIWTNRIDRVAPLLKGTGKPGGGTN